MPFYLRRKMEATRSHLENHPVRRVRGGTGEAVLPSGRLPEVLDSCDLERRSPRRSIELWQAFRRSAYARTRHRGAPDNAREPFCSRNTVGP